MQQLAQVASITQMQLSVPRLVNFPAVNMKKNFIAVLIQFTFTPNYLTSILSSSGNFRLQERWAATEWKLFQETPLKKYDQDHVIFQLLQNPLCH